MAIEKTGFQTTEASTSRSFPKRLVTSDGDGQGICVPDGYTPGQKSEDADMPKSSLTLWNAGARDEDASKVEPSFLRKIAFNIALGLATLAVLPSAFAAGSPGKAGAQPPARDTAIERVVEGEDLQPFREEAFQMTAKDVMGEIGKTAQDLRRLDDSPGQFPSVKNGSASVDGLRGKGEVSVATPQVITRSRSVSGTMSYDSATGEPRSINADISTRIAGNKVTRHVEYTENGADKTYSVSLEGITYRITMGRNASMHETFQSLSAMDVIDEVNRATEDLRSLDDSPEQVLVEQNGRMVSAGAVDRIPGEGEVGVGTPHKLADGRSVSGTYSYDGETGRPKGLRAEVSESSGRFIRTRTVELSQNDTVRTYKVSTGNLTFEVRMEIGGGES
jgi:hypothetical protein